MIGVMNSLPLKNLAKFFIRFFSLKYLIRIIYRLLPLNQYSLISPILRWIYPKKLDLIKWIFMANRIISCPEFSRLEFCPLAGKIVGDKQYFFDGNFTIFPWADDTLHILMKWVKGATEPQEILPFLEIIKTLPEDAIILELGAGWGFYSILFGTRLLKSTMILVEANPRILDITKANIERNGLAERSIVIHGAAYNSDNMVVRFKENGYGSSIESNGDYQVKTTSVDGIMQKLGINRVNILHMDVQGAEREVILSASNALKQGAIDYIFVGTHGIDLHQECESSLRNLGYHTLISVKPGCSVSGDGILICTRCEVNMF